MQRMWSGKRADCHLSRFGLQAVTSIACRGSNRPGMPSAFSLHTVLSLNTSDPDGIRDLRLTTVKRGGNALRVGPRLRIRSGLLKEQIRTE
jgi:hypothetical protein